MRKSQTISLPAAERERLEKFSTTGEHKARYIQHAQVILKAAEGWTDQQIAQATGLSAKTVLQIRHRYLTEGIEAVLSDKPRSGRPAKFDGSVKAVLVATTCSPPPAGHAHWTMRLLANRLIELEVVDGISHETVRDILKKTNSSPGNASTGVFQPSVPLS